MEKKITLADGASGAALMAGVGSNLHVTDDMVDTLRKGLAAGGKGDKLLVAFFDMADSQGWSPSHFLAPESDGSTATPASWALLKGMVASAMPRGVQTLLAMPAEAARNQVAADWSGNDFTESGKPKDKRYWTQQVGSEVAKLGKRWAGVLSAREAKANFHKLRDMIAAGDVDGAAALQGDMAKSAKGRAKSPVEYLDEALTATLSKIERVKESDVDLVAFKELVLVVRGQVRKLAKGKAE